ncbi:MAG: SDR family oxidoreductase [Pseudomonadota bacterium]
MRRTITAEDVAAFAKLSGDYNALHLDDEFAARTEFAGRVVHGFLNASLLSTLIGTRLPGRGALYMSQTIDFTRPVYIGDTVEARATIERIDTPTRLVHLQTEISKVDGERVLKGAAVVKVLRLAEQDRAAPSRAAPPARGLLCGRTALVTGASRGIGRAVARLFAKEGATVWANYLHSARAAEELASLIAADGGRCRIVRADITDAMAASELVAQATAEAGLDILVNNAGPKITSAPFSDLDWSDLATAYDQIVGSVFRVTRAALPALEQRRGTILNIASSAALQRTTHHWLPYVAAKSALLALSRNLAQELGPKGVTVNALSPSLVDTDLVAATPDRVRQGMISRTPLRRLATPDDVAGAALMLVSGHASYITGANLLVTGGETMI